MHMNLSMCAQKERLRKGFANMFKIVMCVHGMQIDMPNDTGLGLLEACFRADCYKKRNSKAQFWVVNEETEDIEYSV